MSHVPAHTKAVLQSLAKTLAAVADGLPGAEVEAAGFDETASYLLHVERNGPRLAALAKRQYDARRRRTQFLSPNLLGEPVWDMMLDLFINHIEGRRVNTTSAAIGACCSVATALRYMAALERDGLIERRASQADRRVTYVELTDEGIRRVGACLLAHSDGSPAVPADASFTSAISLNTTASNDLIA